MKISDNLSIAAVSVITSLCIILTSVFSLAVSRNVLKANCVKQILPSNGNESENTESESTEIESTEIESSELENTELDSTTVSAAHTGTSEPSESTTVSQNDSAQSFVPAAPGYTGSHKIAGEVPENAGVSSYYFNDAVFVGDSISVMLNMYNSSAQRLGEAKFLTSESLSATNALWDVSERSVHPRYKGEKTKVEDAIADMGVKKVYIMLGINDISAVGLNGGIKNFEKLCNNILAKSPNVQLYVQSVTPIAETSSVVTASGGKINNETVYEYNKLLAELCGRRGWYFINVAEVMFNEKGYLKNEYCSDLKKMGIHFNNSGCKAWVDYLYVHTP